MRMIYAIFGILVVIPIVILVFSGGNTQFLDPQYYKLRKLENDTSGLYVLDEELDREARIIGVGKILQNGYKVIYEYEADIDKIDSRIKSGKHLIYSYIDGNGQKNTISYYLCYKYYTYGLWLIGDEGAGFRFKGGDESVWLCNRDNVFYYDKETDTFIKKDKNDK